MLPSLKLLSFFVSKVTVLFVVIQKCCAFQVPSGSLLSPIKIINPKRRRQRRGHFAVYTKECKVFVGPLCYINHSLILILLYCWTDEEFGPTVHGPIQVPFEGGYMEFVVTVIRILVQSLRIVHEETSGTPLSRVRKYSMK